MFYPEKISEHINRVHQGVVSTVNDAGAPQSAYVGVAMAPDGSLVFGTSAKSRKFHNLSARPDVSVVVVEGAVEVQLEGRARVVMGDEAKRYEEVLLAHSPGAAHFVDDPDERQIMVEPTWVRWVDYRNGAQVEEYQPQPQENKKEKAKTMHYDEIQTYTDGGSRGNPGPAASGMVILDAEGNTLEEFGQFLGTATNNVAEWLAVKYVLEAAAKYTPKRIRARMDSELVCKQLNGIYRVKHPDLLPIYHEVLALAKQYDITFEHVYREHNKAADAQVNKAIDQALGITR